MSAPCAHVGVGVCVYDYASVCVCVCVCVRVCYHHYHHHHHCHHLSRFGIVTSRSGINICLSHKGDARTSRSNGAAWPGRRDSAPRRQTPQVPLPRQTLSASLCSFYHSSPLHLALLLSRQRCDGSTLPGSTLNCCIHQQPLSLFLSSCPLSFRTHLRLHRWQASRDFSDVLHEFDSGCPVEWSMWLDSHCATSLPRVIERSKRCANRVGQWATVFVHCIRQADSSSHQILHTTFGYILEELTCLPAEQ